MHTPDYASFETELLFQAGPANSTQCANLSIVDDVVLEGIEVFPGALQLLNIDQSGAVVLSQPLTVAELTILDNDSMLHIHLC